MMDSTRDAIYYAVEGALRDGATADEVRQVVWQSWADAVRDKAKRDDEAGDVAFGRRDR